jgi:lysozyme
MREMNKDKNYIVLKALSIAAIAAYLFWPSDREEGNLIEDFYDIEALEIQERRQRIVRPLYPIDTHISIALNLIKKYEGFRSEPYLCKAGVPTIGYGETDPAIVTRGYISKENAHELLKEKVIMISKDVDKKVLSDLTAHQRAALISFYYNLGPGNFDNIARRINKGKIAEAADAILLYDKCDGHSLKGLQIRRAEEQYLFTL